MARSPNFTMLCEYIEKAMRNRKSGQGLQVTLPPDWKEEWAPDLVSWCELMGYRVAGVSPDKGGSAIIVKN
jgi:hypothetical protein